jgi:hypothetical protein
MRCTRTGKFYLRRNVGKVKNSVQNGNPNSRTSVYFIVQEILTSRKETFLFMMFRVARVDNSFVSLPFGLSLAQSYSLLMAQGRSSYLPLENQSTMLVCFVY